MVMLLLFADDDKTNSEKEKIQRHNQSLDHKIDGGGGGYFDDHQNLM